MKKDLLVTLADKNYIEQAKQLFSSVYYNAGWKGDYMLLAHEIPEKDLKWFRKKGILIHKCIPLFEKGSIGKWPVTVYSKYYLFTPKFKRWKNIVFLDSDIIVRHSLDELTNIKDLAAVQSHNHISKLFINPIHMKLENIDQTGYNSLKKIYNMKLPAFNSGVLAFNSDIIKKDALKSLVYLQKKYAKISASGEEAVFNLYFYSKWKKLSEVYNIYPDYLTLKKNISPEKINGTILHFVLNKPWRLGSPFRAEWEENLKKSSEINLKKKLDGKRWDERSMNKYVKFINKKSLYLSLKSGLFNARLALESYIGLVGIFIKNNFPKLYSKLKWKKKEQ